MQKCKCKTACVQTQKHEQGEEKALSTPRAALRPCSHVSGYSGILLFSLQFKKKKKNPIHTDGKKKNLIHIQRHMQAIRKCHSNIKARGSDITSEHKDMLANQEPEGKQKKDMLA